MRLKILLFITILFFIGCEEKKSESPKSESGAKISSEQIAEVKKSEFILKDELSSNSYTLRQKDRNFKIDGVENKAILMVFFATWCPPCKAEIPHLINLQKNYKDDFLVVSILMEENKDSATLKTFMEEYGINYIVANGSDNVELAKAIGGVKTIPFMLLYDKDGNYARHYVGAVPEEMLELDLKKILGKN